MVKATPATVLAMSPAVATLIAPAVSVSRPASRSTSRSSSPTASGRSSRSPQCASTAVIRCSRNRSISARPHPNSSVPAQGEHRNDAALPGAGQLGEAVRPAHLDQTENPHLTRCLPHTASR